MESDRTRALAGWIREGQEKWPRLRVSVEALENHIDSLGLDVEPVHRQAADLVLACGCAGGDQEALAVFERELLPIARAAVRRIEPAEEFVAEVLQSLRERLLVAREDKKPRIGEYNGKGSLRGWVRVAAMRLAMNSLRDRRPEVLVDDEAFFDLRMRGEGEVDPETRLSWARHCSDGLRHAFEQLGPRERTLLRLHYLDGLTMDELARHEHVHRSTVARRVAAARRSLLRETRAYLQRVLELGEETVDGILQAAGSQIDASISRLLAG